MKKLRAISPTVKFDWKTSRENSIKKRTKTIPKILGVQ